MSETSPTAEQANPETELARDRCSPEDLPHDALQTVPRTEPVVQVSEQINAELENLSVGSGRTQVEEEAEWIEQYEPGVYITLVSLRNGTRDLKRVRFSRKRFGKHQAETWWSDNREKVYERYNVRASDKSSVSGQAARRSEGGIEDEASKMRSSMGPGRKRMAQLKSEWTLLMTSLIIEIASAVFDQLGYALVGMVLAFVALLLSTADLIHMAPKERTSLLPSYLRPSTTHSHGTKGKKPGGTIVEYFGLVGAVWQCFYSTVAYAYARQKKDNPIKMSLLPLIFFSCVVISKLNEKSSLTRVLRKGIF